VLPFAGLPMSAFASTWVDIELTCPVCGTGNLFKKPASFGTYVYQEPSRFQYVFWPATTDTFLYTCRRCHLSAYMQDFSNVPPEKIAPLAAMLERDGALDGAVIPYYEIPMTLRLAIGRRVYEELGRDTEFWCEFHRIAAYHYAESSQPERAHDARATALAEARALLDAEPAASRKELLVIVAAMQFFTGDAAGARDSLSEAEQHTFQSADRESTALDAFLSSLIVDFRSELLSGGEPR